ncbi:MAG TPA: hypothetical protein VF420_15975 [Casimicrobiaceae bacterium]
MYRPGFARLVVAALIAGLATAVNAGLVRPAPDDEELVPTGKGWGERPSAAGACRFFCGGWGQASSSTNGISYHGGPLLLGTPNVYFIWYGNWTGNLAQTLLPALVQSMGGSPYFNINSTYFDGSKNHVTGFANYNGSAADNYSQGAALSDAGVQRVVQHAINSGALPGDSNGVYFVLTSADVNETSGFCTQYCGWHSRGSVGNMDIKYAFVGNPDRCPSACEAQTIGPNGNAGADGMASILSHELEEAITDPDLNAWFDKRGMENADKCAWTFGSTTTLPSGAEYNMTLGGKHFLIQQNWVNASGGYCAKNYP